MIVAPTKEDPGWRGKIMRGINSLAAKLETLTSDEAIKFLTSFEGVKEGDAANLYENLFKPRQTKPRVIRGVDRLREGQIEALSDRNRDLIIRLVKELQPVRIDEREGVSLDGIVQRGETDEPVTFGCRRRCMARRGCRSCPYRGRRSTRSVRSGMLCRGRGRTTAFG